MPTLLLTHPSLASDPQRVSQITAEMVQPVSHQMIDRLASEAVSLPKAHYTGIRVAPSGTKLPTAVVALLADAIIPGGKVEGVSSSQNMDAIMNGFLVSGSDENSVWTKPEPQKVVLLKRRTPAEKTANGAVSLFSKPNSSLASHKTPDSSVSSPALSAASTTSSSASSIASPKRAAAEPWTVDVDDGFSFNGVDDDDDIIDEDALLDGDLPDTIKIPTACQPSGKRRRKACKDCTCGLKELELQEEERRRQNQANVVQLSFDDTAEIDFTVPGKTGSCGNCSLGDAFRCDGCPYLGLPPFKEGEMVSIDALGNDF